MGGGCENKAESVPPLPSLSFSKFRCNAKNGIQTNPKDKNQVSRGIKEALATNLPTKNLCYDIFLQITRRVFLFSLRFRSERLLDISKIF